MSSSKKAARRENAHQLSARDQNAIKMVVKRDIERRFGFMVTPKGVK